MSGQPAVGRQNSVDISRMVPAVGRVLTHPCVRPMIARVGQEIATRLVRQEIARWSGNAERAATNELPTKDEVFETVCQSVVARERMLREHSLRRVINATGIIVHTNLGRAPLSKAAATHVASIAQGYTNLEFDLIAGKRGSRQSHVREILCLLTGAEDVLVVNNNAAALLLALRTLALRRSVVVSRGELIEIGDSFRLLDIMKASGARLVEVGSTNRTHLADYEAAVGQDTGLLLKAHTSNYRTIGFSAAVTLRELSGLARARGIPCLYDLGSGMLRRPTGVPLGDEPSVADVLADGADLITCSGDKLLGGAQAGLLVGKRDIIARLAKAPILRALRPGRLTIAALEDVMREYLDEPRLRAENPTFRMLSRCPDELRQSAEQLLELLSTRGILADLVPSNGQVGGGALPGVALPGWGVALRAPRRSPTTLAAALLRLTPAVLAVLRQGKLVFDVRTLQDDELDLVADAMLAALGQE